VIDFLDKINNNGFFTNGHYRSKGF